MEHPDYFSGYWIHSRNIRALVAITVDASQGKIFGSRGSSVLARDYMVYLKRGGV